MNIELLKVYKYCQKSWGNNKKNKSLVGEAVDENKYYFSLLLRLLGGVPLFVGKRYKLYLESPVYSKTSKIGIAYDELIEDGCESVIYDHTFFGYFYRLIKLFRIIYRLPRALMYITYIRWRSSCAGSSYDALVSLVVYDIYKSFFEKNLHMVPLVISDLGALRYIIGRAASVNGNYGVWYQQDYHHTYNESIVVSSAIVMTDAEAKKIRNVSEDITLYSRPCNNMRRFKSDVRDPRIGLAVNSLFDVSTLSDGFVEKIMCYVGCDSLYIRLHPRNYREVHKKILNKKNFCSFAPQDERLEDYLEKVDVVIVGNSAFALHALILGIPVIHTSGLDPKGYDIYKYVDEGIVFGEESLRYNVIERMNDFYGNTDYYENLKSFVKASDDIDKVANFLCSI